VWEDEAIKAIAEKMGLIEFTCCFIDKMAGENPISLVFHFKGSQTAQVWRSQAPSSGSS